MRPTTASMPARMATDPRSAPAYVAIVIDDPLFPKAIRANLFRPTIEGQPHLLFWQRNQRRREPEQQ